MWSPSTEHLPGYETLDPVSICLGVKPCLQCLPECEALVPVSVCQGVKPWIQWAFAWVWSPGFSLLFQVFFTAAPTPPCCFNQDTQCILSFTHNIYFSLKASWIILFCGGNKFVLPPCSLVISFAIFLLYYREISCIISLSISFFLIAFSLFLIPSYINVDSLPQVSPHSVLLPTAFPVSWYVLEEQETHSSEAN